MTHVMGDSPPLTGDVGAAPRPTGVVEGASFVFGLYALALAPGAVGVREGVEKDGEGRLTLLPVFDSRDGTGRLGVLRLSRKPPKSPASVPDAAPAFFLTPAALSVAGVVATCLAWTSRWISLRKSRATSSVKVDILARRPDGRERRKASYLKKRSWALKLYTRDMDCSSARIAGSDAVAK